MTGPRLVGVLAAVLVVGALAAPVTATPGNESASDVTVGEEGPTIEIDLRTSLFTNLPGPGAVGVNLTGRAMNTTIVRVEVAVVFQGVGDAGQFLANPLSRFATRSTMSLRIPAIADATGDDFSYRDNSTINASG